jgi:hypothetical protein
VLRRCHERAAPPNLAINQYAALSLETRECSTAQAGRKYYFLNNCTDTTLRKQERPVVCLVRLDRPCTLLEGFPVPYFDRPLK